MKLKKISTKEQLFILRNIASLIKCGLTSQEAITLLLTQKNNTRVHEILQKTLLSLEKGKTLSLALNSASGSFSSSLIQLLKIGEEHGTLAENIEYVVKDLESRSALKAKLVSSLIYPCILAVGTLGLSLFLILFIFPKVKTLFAGIKGTLPWSTRSLLWLNDFLVSKSAFLILAFIFIVFAYIFALKKFLKFRFLRDKFFLSLPLTGNITNHFYVASLTRSISSMLNSGATLTESLDHSRHIISNTVWQKTLNESLEKILTGKSFSESLPKEKHIPETLIPVITIGEKTGTLKETLASVSTYHTDELDRRIKLFSHIIEPTLMCLMGLIVGFISLSIITPIYEITNHLK